MRIPNRQTPPGIGGLGGRNPDLLLRIGDNRSIAAVVGQGNGQRNPVLTLYARLLAGPVDFDPDEVMARGIRGRVVGSQPEIELFCLSACDLFALRCQKRRDESS